MTTAAVVDDRHTARFVEHVMGMPISVALRGRHTDDEVARSAWADVVTELRWVDRVFSTYRPDSFVSQLSRGDIAVEVCPAEVAEVLELGAAAERDSFGAFSIRRAGPDGSITLDPSGVVKGWAVERAAAFLERLPGTDFCLSAGGDVTCRTVVPDAQPWRIGIEDPFDVSRTRAVIPVFNGAVATSGAARRGRHIVDARTGRAPTSVASVTVVTRSLTVADIDATAAYALDADAARWLGSRRGRSGLVIWADGSTTTVEPDNSSKALIGSD